METEGRFYIKAAAAAAAAGGRGGGYGGGTKCGRWNPTAEQVKVLTDLFRSGLRTPSTDQIQRISSQLSYYGKIESKNVFYWFQNHKARERQKRRKLVSHVSLVDDSSTAINNPSCNQPPTKQHIGSRMKKQVVEGAESCSRVMETLELFPMNPFDEVVLQESEKICYRPNDCSRDLSHAFGSDIYHMDHPPLDLRLSFV